MKIHYLGILVFLFSIGCSKKKEKLVTLISEKDVISVCADTVSVSYSKTIQPILNTYCIKCHDATTAQNFTTYIGTVPFAKAGILADCITGSNGEILMPPSNESKMDTCSIKAIKQWIKEECKNN